MISKEEIEAMKAGGLSDQDISEIAEARRFQGTNISPAYFGLPTIEEEYGSEIDWLIKDGQEVPGLYITNDGQWYFCRDLVADRRPARRSFTDMFGRLHRQVVLSMTAEEWNVIRRSR